MSMAARTAQATLKLILQQLLDCTVNVKLCCRILMSADFHPLRLL